MADNEHLNRLRQGVTEWNRWRDANPQERPNLQRADLSRTDLTGANLQGAILSEADLREAVLDRAILSRAILTKATLGNVYLREALLIRTNIGEADLGGANLDGANLRWASLRRANLKRATLKSAKLRGANLRGADLAEADLRHADLRLANLSWAKVNDAELTKANLSGADLSRSWFAGANLTEANLSYTRMVNVNLERAIIVNCNIHGISAWNLDLTSAIQSNLSITDKDGPRITVDNLEVGQFIYLLLNNQSIRSVINTITSKLVLLLGRFTPDRKVVLDALREELRGHDLLPVIFDFDKPSGRNLTETISTLAHMARFVIADLTDAQSVPQELQRIVPDLPSLPVQPIILSSQYEYSMFRDFLDYPWVLSPYRYPDLESLTASVGENVIAPAVLKANEIQARRMAFEVRPSD